MTLRWSSPKRLAAVGVAAQFLALSRTLGEICRIKYFVLTDTL
jgi:hypothetical protein